MDAGFRQKIMDVVLKDNKKEYACHLQYVVEAGLRLAKEYKVDEDVIETACLLHDIGRDKELPGEVHSQTSHRLVADILADSPLSEAQRENVLACVLLHNSEETPETIEQQIVRSADAGSKVEYHEAFMLMCKKQTYEEHLAWGMKYLEKGYRKTCLESYRSRIQEKYEAINLIYQRTLETINHVRER
jgi:putative nucleotidyltransferase with HDIG domain